jgi:hypothetical protein
MYDTATSVADPHHLDADPDPASYFDADPDPDPACYFDADPDPAYHFDADPDPDPTFQFDEGPCGSGSTTLTDNRVRYEPCYSTSQPGKGFRRTVT